MPTYRVLVTNGATYWFKYDTDKYHREDGPAIEHANGEKRWYFDGLCHRRNGPAIEYSDGGKSWYLEGKELTEEQFNQKMQNNSCDGKFVEIDGKKYKLIAV